MDWKLVLLAVHLISGTKQLVSAAAAGEKQQQQLLVSVTIDTKQPVARIDDNFVCATLDWWPPEKCDYGTCSWGRSSLLNLDLTNQRFREAVKGLAPVLLRLGGSLQDQIVYELGSNPGPCSPLVKRTDTMFGFTGGCLNMSRWQELNTFFNATGASIAFGLNALYGRKDGKGAYTLPWDSTNARDLIQYSVDRGYDIVAWELGNELSGSGVGTSISSKEYAADMKELRSIVNNVYAKFTSKPLVVAPDGFYDAGWYYDLLQKSQGAIDVLSHHIYNLGPGVDTHLIEKILDPSYLDQEANTFASLQNILKTSGFSAQAWVGEAGGAYNSGHHNVTDRFVFSFWYLDQLGMAAVHNTTVYCRQSLIGGNYGLVSNSFDLNPDYFSALIWKKLMGKNVFSTTAPPNATYLRTYGHCLKNNEGGLALLLINLSNSTEYLVDVPLIQSRPGCTCKQKSQRSEYHLRAMNDNIQSPIVLLNGKPLQASENGSIPSLEPIFMSSSSRISVLPFSIVFAAIPNAGIASCTV